MKYSNFRSRCSVPENGRAGQAPRSMADSPPWHILKRSPVQAATAFLLMLYIVAVVLLVTSASGCVTVPTQLQSLENRYGVHLSMPFDNAQDEGPSYLVGPPSRRAVRSTTSSTVNAAAEPSPALSFDPALLRSATDRETASLTPLESHDRSLITTASR